MTIGESGNIDEPVNLIVSLSTQLHFQQYRPEQSSTNQNSRLFLRQGATIQKDWLQTKTIKKTFFIQCIL